MAITGLGVGVLDAFLGVLGGYLLLFYLSYFLFSLFARNTRTGIPMFPSATQALLVRDRPKQGSLSPVSLLFPQVFVARLNRLHL